MKRFKRISAVIAAGALVLGASAFGGCSKDENTVTLRVCSWEEYIDLGEWEDDELIDVENPYADGGIIGVNSMVDDFTEWFNSGDNGFKVKVEYSTFGTNEDLYNRLSLGDEYDLVCPSDYMLMKLIDEGNYLEFSDGFWDLGKEENYYAKNVSGYIDREDGSVFSDYGWHKKAACYMWGTTGIVYNPKLCKDEDVSTFAVLKNPDYARRVTIKDNVRDAYFATLGMLNSDKLGGQTLTGEELSAVMNDVSPETVARAQELLKDVKGNVYSFETDSGKADMITGKVVANYQWSGDAVYILDEAEGDENHPTELWYSVPKECANLWFDGWLMLKNGDKADEKKQRAAEAFVNFLSRPDNAVRNMYYIGYTSAIAGQTVFDYMDWNYGAEEGAESLDYDLSWFFGDGYSIEAEAALFGLDERGEITRGRQLFAQYPSASVIDRSVVMLDFGDKLADLNQMWINVRCLDLKDIPAATVIIVTVLVVLVAAAVTLYALRYRIFVKKPKKTVGKDKKSKI